MDENDSTESESSMFNSIVTPLIICYIISDVNKWGWITVKTICSKEDFVVKHFDNLRQKITDRGYPVEVVEENLDRGGALIKVDLLKLRPVCSISNR